MIPEEKMIEDFENWLIKEIGLTEENARQYKIDTNIMWTAWKAATLHMLRKNEKKIIKTNLDVNLIS
jgi:hypothetical protein